MINHPSSPKKAHPYKFSLSRFLWLDYPAYNLLLFPFLTWAITGFLAFLDYRSAWSGNGTGAISSTTRALFYVAIFLSLVCIPMLLARLGLFWKIYRGGLETPGKITQVLFQRDRAQIYIAFTYKDIPYKGRIVLHRTRLSQSLQKDQKVSLVVLPQDPTQVFIRDLYLETRHER